MTLLLNTHAVPPRERLAYWTDMICNTYVQLECDAIESDRFAGSINSQSMPGLDLSVVASGAQKVLRTPRHIARANDDYFLVSIQTQGKGVLRQDGRDALLNPGDFALYDSTRAYELHFEGDFQQIVLKLPGEQLRSAVRDTEKLTATTVSGRAGAGHLMIGMIKTLWEDIDALEPASAVAVAGGVLNILVAGLQTLPASKRRGVSTLTSYHLTRIKGEIDSRLRNPALTVSDVARDLGISVGHIHRLFRQEATSPAQYIWSRRLEMCSRDLVDPRCAGQSISEIAFSWGFNDAAHFSRSFRDRFGVPPREWRGRPSLT
ncbi:transcriptional regulator FeaR [Ramlibacter sp. WS9]|uniref:transcriptional regulator FeaR n=1 Tax=Ramlibacter sp. WS9 TaxID=1882741 RepID=UPI001142006F|nr:transcriptional regulator FeaR [Ramlibacter sp. WS9]ROZ77630.1 transcriptional regulator FeaR [Ramlibacter sp. WS9]